MTHTSFLTHTAATTALLASLLVGAASAAEPVRLPVSAVVATPAQALAATHLATATDAPVADAAATPSRDQTLRAARERREQLRARFASMIRFAP